MAVRSNGNTCSFGNPANAKNWQLNFNTRYFKSYKHFIGKEEQKLRLEEGTEVFNDSFSWDFTLTPNFSKLWSASLNIPLLSNVRSSLYEHYGNSSVSPNA